ncbi:hypothetical protein E0K83_06510 [Gramella sp. BOM4]|nr:hypothetical protein [Christiangramia bathymodioli]
MKLEAFIKALLAILLFVCLLDMPYGFYELVRFAAFFGFGVLAYKANKKNNEIEIIIYIGLALLFQPFFKIALGREIWNMVDNIIGMGLIISIFFGQRNIFNKQSN